MNKPKCSCEIRVSCLNETPCEIANLDAPEKALEYWQNVIAKMPWYDPEREMCVVIILNTRYSPLGHGIVGIGTVNESVAHPRDFFRPAIASGAYAIIAMHDHPSGDPSPSEADNRLTRRLSEAGKLLKIPLLDHVI